MHIGGGDSIVRNDTHDFDANALSVRSLKPLRRADMVTEELRDAILSGALRAGTRLRQAEIAKSFGVSTTPVREAFVALQRQGLLAGDPHKGVVVFRPSAEDLLENLEIRTALEVLATEKAAERITPADLSELEALLTAMCRSADAFEYPELNRRFHARTYVIAGRPRLLALIDDLRGASMAYMNIVASSGGYSEDRQKEHAAIVDALRARSPELAGRAMRAHLDAAGRTLLAHVSDVALTR